MTEMTFDSTVGTREHIDRVGQLLDAVRANIQRRAESHDASKLDSPEKEAFDLLGERQRGIKYGTPEYFAQFDTVPGMKQAILHHYAGGRHHPEHFAMLSDGTVDKDAVRGGEAVSRMSLLDIIEMVVDWRAASERYKDGSIADSIDHNTGRFGLSPQLASIIRNTVEELGL